MLKIPCDYDVDFKNRKKFKNKSGGIVVIYKEYLSNYFKILDSDSDFVQWIEITKNISLLNENFVLGCTYIPPELCKRCNLFIANGRIFNDQGIGKTTCKNVSLVDYLLLTPHLFDVISD